ncbi:hypothetical protein ABES02_05005 [Neobacillus pocheonensis]|uniref:hypothetical protein n=1 Tax=Neobacillus pocheonensis TaxID=363869 RepID=UPI003D2D4C48
MGVLIVFLFGLFFFLLGWIFWGMGENGETFWVALLETLADIFSEFLFASYRTVALIFWVMGFLFVVLGLITLKNPEILPIFFNR